VAPRVRECMWILAVFAGFLLSCGKKSSEPESAAPSASAPVVATFEPPPAAPPASEVPTIAPPIAPPAAPKAPEGAQVKACCSALHAAEAKATAKDKSALLTAAGACDGIAKLVANGTTKHADAITSIRATMKGAPLPSACR